MLLRCGHETSKVIHDQLSFTVNLHNFPWVTSHCNTFQTLLKGSVFHIYADKITCLWVWCMKSCAMVVPLRIWSFVRCVPLFADCALKCWKVWGESYLLTLWVTCYFSLVKDKGAWLWLWNFLCTGETERDAVAPLYHVVGIGWCGNWTTGGN